MHYFINKFTVTGNVQEFHSLLAAINENLTKQPEFKSHRLYQSASDPEIYVETAEWESAAGAQAGH